VIGHVVADGIVGVIEPSMRLSLVLLALVAGLSSGASFAQEEPDAATVPLDRFRSTIDDKGLGTTEGGAIPGHLGFQGGLILNYALNPLVLRDPDGVVIAPIVAHRLVGDALFTIGLFDYVSIGVDLPMTLVQVGGAVPDNVADAVGFASGLSVIGLGDLRLVPKVRLLREDAHGVSLSVIPTITLPTAGGIRFNDDGPSYEYGGDYLGEGPGAFAFIPEVAISTNIFGLRPAANLAYRLRQPTRLLGEFAIHPELVYRLGVGYDVGASVKDLAGLLVFAEIFGATADRNPFGLIDDSNPAEVRLQNPMEALAGARYNVGGGFIIEGGIGTGLRAGFGSPDLRVFAGVRRVFENRDRDGDGIDDDKDTCPDDPEDKDGFDDQDGCPDLDNDGDGIPDGSDGCPNESEDQDGFEDQDGCPDPDNDGDGILDIDDDCRDVKGTARYRGCPAPDTDGDGLADDADACPDVPGIPEKNGCPHDDRDDDGIKDTADLCPDVKGVISAGGCPDRDGDGVADDADECPDDAGPVSLKGCPDSDKDGIIDKNDKCPNEPETINGFQDDDGCPDKGKVLVTVTKEKIELKETVFFDSGRDTIQKRSFSLLDQISLVLKAHPEVKRVRIEGHTDSDGSEEGNLDLSKRRAKAVLDALVARGVEAERLSFEGFGESQPIASNKTKAGKAQNRRVELAIVDQ